MTFYETRFPTDIGGAAVGGPMRITDIVTLRSGYEEVNAIWQHSRRRWDASYGIKTADDLHTVLEFWEAMDGRRHQFRWKDHADYKSCAPLQAVSATDQVIGTGDGNTATFQLIKTYSAGSASYARPIKKPVSGTVKVSLNDVELLTGWEVDTATGIITFTGNGWDLDFINDEYVFGNAPANGVTVKAGYEFDVPARFENDTLSTQLELYHGGQASIEIMEVRV